MLCKREGVKVEEPAISMWVSRWCWESMNSRRGNGIREDPEGEKTLLSSRKLMSASVAGA